MAFITFQPSDHFNTKLWTGDGTTSNAQTGIGFQPDLVWTKGRSDAYDNTLTDAVRGATKYLISNSTNAEATGNIVTSFDSDGFTLGDRGEANYSGRTYVGWNWKANGSGSANTDGSISSTISANTTAGFSIVSYTGTGSNATVGHGLGVAPSMMIFKNRDRGDYGWRVYHKSIGATKNLNLQSTAVEETSSSRFNDTEPTSSVFSIGTDLALNTSSQDIIAYCFAEKKGFSKFGLYEGNGNADGAFVYTGFKPAFVLYKGKGAVQSWNIQDNKRLGYNPNNAFLFPNLSQAESDITRIDLYSNGFKLRTTDAGQNGSGQGYVYMAFAEFPIVSSNDIPATAR